MDAEPSFQAFEATYNGGKPQVLWTRMIADLETPVSAMIKLVGGAPKSFLLESVEGGSIRGRYSFLDMQPDLIWRCHGNSAEINRNALQDPCAFQPCPVSEDAGTLASFHGVLAESRIELPCRWPAICGQDGGTSAPLHRTRSDIAVSFIPAPCR